MFVRATGAAALLLAGLLTPHPATAQSQRSLSSIRVAFAYHPEDSAEAIYAHLQATARDACTDSGSRSLKLHAYEKACARDLLAKAVAQIGRADLAELNAANTAPLALAAR
jgi:UrcA family protein